MCALELVRESGLGAAPFGVKGAGVDLPGAPPSNFEGGSSPGTKGRQPANTPVAQPLLAVYQRQPADTETKQVARYCYEHGLNVLTAGTFNNVIRILVPLVITDEQFDEGLAVLESALAAVAEPKHAALSRA